MKPRQKTLLVFILIIIILLTYNELSQRGDKSLPPEEIDSHSPEIKLSALPDELKNSLQEIIDKINKNNENYSFNLLLFNQEERIEPSTPLILETYYSKSDTISKQITEMPAEFVGVSIKELKAVTEEWQVKEHHKGDMLVLYREVNDLDPELKKEMHIGIKDGKVAIYYGSSGQKYVKKITDIKVKKLNRSIREDLKNGITVKDQEELVSILEGLISIVNKD